MNLNKIIVVMLMLFMILSNALPAGAVRGKKRSVAQRKSESDSYSMDSSDDSDDDDYVDSDDDDGVDSETEDECVDMDVFDSEEDASNLGDAPAKKRRLSSIGFDESKILVMKLGSSEVKTFNDFSGAVNWLQAHGWSSDRLWNIKRAIRKLSLAYGWGWEVRAKSEELIKLLDAELSPEQIKEAKNHTRNAKQLQMMKGPELETKSEDVSVEDDSLIASELPVGTLPCTHDTVVGMPIEGIENRSETAAIFGSDQLNDMSSSDAENAAGICRFEDLVQYAFY